MTLRNRFGLMVFSIVLFLSSGCSVFMAANQPDKKNVDLFNVGTQRSMLLGEFGTPALSETRDGKDYDTFRFVQGYSTGAKVGRAVFHGVADVLTIGLWEIVGTPTELVFDGDTMAFEVGYDAENKVDQVTVIKGQGLLNESAPRCVEDARSGVTCYKQKKQPEVEEAKEVVKVEEVAKVEEVVKVESVEEVEEVGAIKKTSFKSSEAIVISTGSSKLVGNSPEEWIDAVVTVSAGMGHGSGFVISENQILTNHHVVGESKSVAIKFSNGLQLIGKVIASDSERDVAVVKVDATLPKYFHLSRNTPVLGADVYAIGTPLDEKLHSTISRGIISALRVVQNKTLIQSDINIHSGSSGGPLLYKSGTVVGIAVSQFAVNKTSQGISFFIPIDDALKSLEVI